MPRSNIEIPFNVDRTARIELTDQISQGMRGAIRNGAFAPGQRLPGIRQIARALGTSNIVVTQAMRHLADEGLIVSRPRSGTRVASTDERIWRGHVLWLGGEKQSYFFATREETVSKGLEKLNLRLTAINVSQEKESSMANLTSCLQTMGISLVINTVDVPGIHGLCIKNNVKHIDCSSDPISSASGFLKKDANIAITRLVEHVKDLGVHQLMVLGGHDKKHIQSAEEAFAKHELALMVESIDWQDRISVMESFEHSGYETMKKLIREDRLPELIYVTEDHMTRGCLTALLENGVRVPEDVQLIITANRGNSIANRCEFTRIENDPIAEGETILKIISDVLDEKKQQTSVQQIIPRFIVGNSTCQLKKGKNQKQGD